MFEVMVLESIFVYERIIVIYFSYLGVFYMLDFGEDVVFIMENIFVFYIYYIDGWYSGYGCVLLGEYGEV